MKRACTLRLRSLPLLATACVALSCLGVATIHAKDAAAAEKHTAAAKAIAGTDIEYLTHLCGGQQGEFLRSLPQPVTPYKLFDNLYFLGFNFVTSLAINTSAGIILIDALDNAGEADKYIIDGLKKAGLDPSNVKYVIATHGHADHYGGMQELKNKIPGVRLMMGPADWEYAAIRAAGDPKAVKPPAKDLSAADGQKLTLGDETITMYITPGHTPGSLGFIIPVKDHGTPHVLSLWGGTTMPALAYELAEYKVQLDRFHAIEKAAHSEGRLSTHPGWTGMLAKMEKMRANPNGPNPFLEGPEYMARYEKVHEECRQATIAQIP